MKWIWLLSLLVGCSVLDVHEKIKEWPSLIIVEHYVSDERLREICSKYTFLPEACSEFYFDQGECHIWFNKEFPPLNFIKQHEYLHCQGYDHIGSNNLRIILENYKKGKQ